MLAEQAANITVPDHDAVALAVRRNSHRGAAGGSVPDCCGLPPKVNAVATEMELLDAFVDAVRALDPDILVGYDVRKVSDGPLLSGNTLLNNACWLCFSAYRSPL